MSARVAVVTGAARGIGAAVVHELAREGWRVVAVDVCRDDPAVDYPLGTLEELTAVADPYDGDVTPLVADVRDAGRLREAVAVAQERYGGLDAAVAAAAVIAGGTPLWETPEKTWDVLHDVDVRGVYHLACAAVPAMLARPAPRSGRFVAVASVAAHRGLFGLAAYGAAKHAVVGLVRGLAADLRGTGVTAVAVSPGSTRTSMLDATARLYGLDSTEHFTSRQLHDRLLEPEEIARAIAWLCSPNAGAVAGSVLRADGGFTV
ncbi:oxidoreductase [Carbonactinospora thermoautotrophica]|uniref:Oxidoreductase n=3 Tax=Carbonactinospora thermoautotrophica TaxID=1469144 RepID=A0A132N5W9_9ACTN|nr:mycofactocin-coupled SDR family oxidoreductase [Carbonactinospora thermoautotrophica]KWX05504.1 oxidoreductase [Carbonactinospora thermoautotrophica]